jgi:hypothetical protein
VSTGGTTGSGGKGGTTGTGGTVSTGGTTGTGGVIATGGTPGTGGIVGTGGIAGGGGGGQIGTGGQAGSSATGGASGAGGAAGGGGAAAGAGGAGTGGAAGGGGGGAAGAPGGNGGHGGASGASGAGGAAVCVVGSSTLDCSSTGALTLTPDGMVTDFSASQWSPTAMAWCNSDGLSGSTFGYLGGSTTAPPVAVDTTAGNLKMNLTVGANGYAGGGILFNQCVNASGFNTLSFSAVVTAGSLTNCTWLVQLQTQDQRPTDAMNPSGGTCVKSSTNPCYGSPAVNNLAAPGTTGMTYTEPFTMFTPMTTIPMATQVVGVQWQVNGGTAAGCTVELRVDNIKFVTQ